MIFILSLLATLTFSQADTSRLSILAYNIQMLPVAARNTNQQDRIKYIAPQMKPYDVVVFSEAFDDGMRAILIEDMKASFPYHTCVLGHKEECKEGDRGLCQDGGVLIFSKYPILEQDQRMYYKTDCDLNLREIAFGETRKECWGSDCFARKGVLYAKVHKNGKSYHIFGSHLQASYDRNAKYRLARELQLNTLAKFIEQKGISKSEPVIIAGDLNVDMLSSLDEYHTMLRILNAVYPTSLGPAYTYNPNNNCLAEGGAPEYIDYILFHKGHKLPIRATIETKLLQCEQPYKRNKTRCNALSDHYPVACIATFD